MNTPMPVSTVAMESRTDDTADQARAIASLAETLADNRCAVFGPTELVRRVDPMTVARMMEHERLTGSYVLLVAGNTHHRATLYGAMATALERTDAGEIVYILPPRRTSVPQPRNAGARADPVPSFGCTESAPAPSFGLPPPTQHTIGFGGVVVPAGMSAQEAFRVSTDAIRAAFGGGFSDDTGPDGGAVACWRCEQPPARTGASVEWARDTIANAWAPLRERLRPGVYAILFRDVGSCAARVYLYGPYDSHEDARCVIRRTGDNWRPFAVHGTINLTAAVPAEAEVRFYEKWFGPCATPGMDDGRHIRDIVIVDVRLPGGVTAEMITEDAWALLAIAKLTAEINDVRRPGRPFVVVIAERWYPGRTFGALRLMGAFATAEIARANNKYFGGLRDGCPRYIVDGDGAAVRIA